MALPFCSPPSAPPVSLRAPLLWNPGIVPTAPHYHVLHSREGGRSKRTASSASLDSSLTWAGLGWAGHSLGWAGPPANEPPRSWAGHSSRAGAGGRASHTVTVCASADREERNNFPTELQFSVSNIALRFSASGSSLTFARRPSDTSSTTCPNLLIFGNRKYRVGGSAAARAQLERAHARAHNRYHRQSVVAPRSPGAHLSLNLVVRASQIAM